MSHTEPSFVGDAVVGPRGQIELETPLPPNSHVRIAVYPADDFSDLLAASTSTLDFWDNPLDDEDWNNAGPG